MTTRWPLVQIVDAPTTTAQTLYDFNDSSFPDVRTAALADGWSLGVPQLKGDPDAPGVQWGLRQLTLVQKIVGTKSAALGRQSALARVLLRPRAWVMFQLNAFTAPVWWHAYRSQPGDLSFEYVVADPFDDDTDRPQGDHWRIGVQLDADPFGYAERIDLPTLTVSAAGGVQLPALLGDAPAGLRVSVTRSDGASSSLGSTARVAVVATQTDALPTVVLDLGDGAWSSGPGTAVSGGHRVTTFADTAVATRVAGTVITVAPGTYLALLRASGGVLATAQRTVTTVLQVAGLPSTRKTQTLPAGATSAWLDLGTVTVGRRLPDDLPNTAQPGALVLQVGSNLTGWSLTYGDLLLIPVGMDEQTTTTMLSVAATTLPAGAPTLVVDADTETAWLTGTDPAYGYGSTGALSGGVPVADPAAARNTLLVLGGSRTATGSPIPDVQQPTADTATYQVTVSYHPRVVWLGDGTPSPLAQGTP